MGGRRGALRINKKYKYTSANAGPNRSPAELKKGKEEGGGESFLKTLGSDEVDISERSTR